MFEIRAKIVLKKLNTYFKLGETKIADFDLHIRANKHIHTFDITMNNTELVHVLEHATGFQSKA